MTTEAPSKPKQAVTGLMPPALGEAIIRSTWPSLTDVSAAVTGLASLCFRTILLARFGWLLLLPLFVLRIAPFRAKRYTLTNRRLMIQRGLKPKPKQEVKLEDIDEVRLEEGSYSGFYHSGTLLIVSKDQVVMKLTGVPEPEGFRHAIVNAVAAWVPSKSSKVLPVTPPANAK